MTASTRIVSFKIRPVENPEIVPDGESGETIPTEIEPAGIADATAKLFSAS